MTETHIFMSDDPKHDTTFVNDNMQELLPVWHARRRCVPARREQSGTTGLAHHALGQRTSTL